VGVADEVDGAGAAAQAGDLFAGAVEVVEVGQLDQVPDSGADHVPQVEVAGHRQEDPFR